MKLKFGLSAAFAVLVLGLPAPVLATGEATFSYQGRVRVQGQPYNGVGQFKFAIVSTSGTATLWSNDGSSQNGDEPAAYVLLLVEGGVFSALVGDPSAGMETINGTIFNSQTPLKLRVWFNDGDNGFQQLQPDHTLVNLTLNVLETGQEDFTIYVNGGTGDDSNNGLSPQTAKKTVQGAVDILPDRVNGNVTVDIAPGVYYEEVSLHGISVARTKTVTFVGDEAWNPGSANTPDTVISGGESASASRLRDYGFYATQCTGVNVQGIHFTKAKVDGAAFLNGLYTVENCLATDNGDAGLRAAKQCETNFTNCHAAENDIAGFSIWTASRSTMTSCSATLNDLYGVRVFNQCQCNFVEKGEFSNNGSVGPPECGGVQAAVFSDVGFSIPFSGGVRNNIGFGLDVGWHAYVIYTTQAIITGNGQNTRTKFGGTIYP